MEKPFTEEWGAESIKLQITRPAVRPSTLKMFGFIQVLIGTIIILMGIVAIEMQCHFAHIGIPYYAGFLVVTTGLIGMASARKRSSDIVVAATVFSFLSATFCVTALVIVMAVALGNEDNSYAWAYGKETCHEDFRDYNSLCQRQFRQTLPTRQSIDTFILMMGICEAIIAFTNGVLLLRYSCYRGNKGCNLKASDTKRCCTDFCKGALACCKPSQVYIYQGQSDGTFAPVPMRTFPAGQDNALVGMVTTNTTGAVKISDVIEISNPGNILSEDSDIVTSEASPLLD